MNVLEDYFARMRETRLLMQNVEVQSLKGKVFQYHVHVHNLLEESEQPAEKLEDFRALIPADFPISRALKNIEDQWGGVFLATHGKPAGMAIAYVQIPDNVQSFNYNLPVGYVFPDRCRIDVHAECDVAQVIELNPLKDSEKLPVLLLTGFLGSGKTTLMNHILTGNHGKKFAIIQNEFGSVDVDGELVSQKLTTNQDIQVLDNGCMCCTVRGDLVEALQNIVKKISETDAEMDGILIETTGMADPQPILAVFSDQMAVGDLLRLDSVLTVVDSKRISEQLDRKVDDGVNEAVQQVIFADRILLNKSDTVTGEEMRNARNKIRSINKFCRIHPTTFSKIDLDKIFDQQSHSLEKLGELGDKILEMAKEDHDHDHVHTENCNHHSHKHDNDHGHNGDHHEHNHKKHDHEHKEGHEHKGHGHDHERKEEHTHKKHDHEHKEHDHEHKEGHEHKKHDHEHKKGHEHKEGHGHDHEHKEDHKHKKHDHEHKEEHKKGHDHEHKKEHDHKHDHEKKHDHKHGHHDHKHANKKVNETRHSSGVSSIGFSREGEIVQERLQAFIQDLLKKKYKDLYRYKGICAIFRSERKFVLQGVHESVQFDWLGKRPKTEKKQCTMVFIGKDLNKKEIEEGFNACFYQPKRSLENPTRPVESPVKRQKL